MSSAARPHRRIFLKQVASVAGATPLVMAAGAAVAAPEPAEHAWRFFNGSEALADYYAGR